MEVNLGPMLASQPCFACFLGFDIPTSSFIVIENVFYYSYIYIHVYIGTASAAMWTFRAEGRLFHSGLPHKVYKRYMYMYMYDCVSPQVWGPIFNHLYINTLFLTCLLMFMLIVKHYNTD